jgi:hypothetical protein
MKANRFWIETMALGTAIACALALLIATLAGATAAVTGNGEPRQTAASTPPVARTFEGMVACSRCGAKHSAAMGKTAADCTRQCVHIGANFALIDGDRTYTLEGDLSALKRVAGQRAHVVGTLHGNTILVSSVAAEN